MSKITFRADDDLIDRLEALERSKSEVMREALRTYLDSAGGPSGRNEPQYSPEGSLDALVTGRVDELVAGRIDELVAERVDGDGGRRDVARSPQDVNVTVTLDGETSTEGRRIERKTRRETSDDEPGSEMESGSGTEPRSERKRCGQCGESVEADHVYCPNCGEKATRRLFCECGDELRSDWGFCPGCGRRTPTADVLDRA